MTCDPRWATPRTPSRRTMGDQAAKLAVALGKPFLPWQRQVADVALELDDEGRFVYRDVVLTVGRQAGKTLLMLVVMFLRALNWEGSVIRYSAQTGMAARAKLIDDWLPMLKPSPLARYYEPRLASGHESLLFHNGSHIGLLAGTQKSGHGSTVDLGIIDEAFAAPDARLEQAIRPAAMTRDNAQLWITSAAGTPALSPYLLGKVEAGRQLVDAGVTKGTAYFDWSAEDDADPADPATWRSCMPALGLTTSEEVVATDFASMQEAEFTRAYLNRWTAQRANPGLPVDAWLALTDETSRASDPVFLAFDVSPDRAHAAIAAAGQREGGDGWHVEIVEHRAGTGWVVDRLEELKRKHRPAGIFCDPSGPAGGLLADIERRGLKVTNVTTKEHGQACGVLYDAVIQGTVAHLGTPELTDAIDGAVKRHLSDGAWLWNRCTSAVDICPLVASTIALWAAQKGQRQVHVWDTATIFDDKWDRMLGMKTPLPPELQGGT